MVDISFKPTFTNVDFTPDDPVQAGPHDGLNGFNGRFNAIEADLHTLSTVVAQVDTALSEGTAGVTQRRLLLAPAMIAPTGTHPWVIGSGGTASVTPGSDASGLLNLMLPAGVNLASFRALGQATDAVASISLIRVPYGSTAQQTLASVSGDANPFDRSANIDPGAALTTPATTRYFIQATVPATPATAVVSIAAFQITYNVD